MSTITRIDLAETLSKDLGLTMTDSYKLVELVFSEIVEALVRGEDVKISNLGTFRILNKPERMGRNPKTGIPAVIAARNVASFRPSKEFRQQVAKIKK